MRRPRLLNPHILAVMENEWAQLIRNRVVVFTTLIPPILLVTMAVSMLVLTSLLEAAPERIGETATEVLGTVPGLDDILVSGADSISATLLNPFLVLFQIIPLVVPITIASYSIVGEKQQRSLEPLLSTPIETWELLTAKGLAAAIPGVLSTWWGFAIFLVAARFFATDAVYNKLILSPTWVLTMLLITPIFTMLAVSLGVIISSRVKDPNSAQQLGSLVILPVVAVLAGQVSGVVSLGVGLILTVAFAVAVLDVILLFISVRTFRREEILTNWS
jgi:ABC-2 type transport system permease protein